MSGFSRKKDPCKHGEGTPRDLVSHSQTASRNHQGLPEKNTAAHFIQRKAHRFPASFHRTGLRLGEFVRLSGQIPNSKPLQTKPNRWISTHPQSGSNSGNPKNRFVSPLGSLSRHAQNDRCKLNQLQCFKVAGSRENWDQSKLRIGPKQPEKGYPEFSRRFSMHHDPRKVTTHLGPV